MVCLLDCPGLGSVQLIRIVTRVGEEDKRAQMRVNCNPKREHVVLSGTMTGTSCDRNPALDICCFEHFSAEKQQ